MNLFKTFFLLLVLFLTSSCNHIETGDTLSQGDIKHIKSLGLLSDDEKIIKFYSEFRNKVAGNFYTSKRMANYWIDERDKSKTKLNSAFYHEIISIDTVLFAGSTYCPYMLVTKADSTKFKVCVEGKDEDIRAFFEEAIGLWKAKKVKADYYSR